jgi:hypothetical protein
MGSIELAGAPVSEVHESWQADICELVSLTKVRHLKYLSSGTMDQRSTRPAHPLSKPALKGQPNPN